jgi:hypothetical protein
MNQTKLGSKVGFVQPSMRVAPKQHFNTQVFKKIRPESNFKPA